MPCPQVTITVLDENDNSPQFDITSDSSVSVAEDSTVGKRVAVVLARDPDAGSNGQVGEAGAEGSGLPLRLRLRFRNASIGAFPTPSPLRHPCQSKLVVGASGLGGGCAVGTGCFPVEACLQARDKHRPWAGQGKEFCGTHVNRSLAI